MIFIIELVKELQAEIAALKLSNESGIDENEKLKESIKKLQSTCLAAAEEIQSKWDAHCDSDGYGPANLMRRLENGVGDYYSGYNAGQFTKIETQLQQGIERQRGYKELLERLDDYFDNYADADYIQEQYSPNPEMVFLSEIRQLLNK